MRTAMELRPYRRVSSQVTSPALIINRWSGDGKAERYGLEAAARRRGIRTIMLEPGDDLVTLARGAIADGADAIGMAGGDGSLGLVAGVALEEDVPFFCVPVGTRNHFALDLGLDRDDPLTSLEALADGEELLIDVGMANDRLFLNNASFGVYAQAVHREGYRGDKEATIAAVVGDAAGNPEGQAAIRYTTPDGASHHRAPLILVSNNPYVMSGPPDYGRRIRMDAGRLGVRTVTSLAAADDVTAALLLRSSYEWTTTDLVLESDEPILAGVDGEALVFESPLALTIRTGLRVLVPAGTLPGYLPAAGIPAAQVKDLIGLGGEVDL